MSKKSDSGSAVRAIADNRRARRDYFIDETFEAGIVLTGTEVKSLRTGQATISEAYAAENDGEIFLFNAYIPEYAPARGANHEPRRPRKLLLHRRHIDRLIGATLRRGITLVPLKLYFNDKGVAKVELATARGKKLHDKRQTEKDRSWQREQGRLRREQG